MVESCSVCIMCLRCCVSTGKGRQLITQPHHRAVADAGLHST